MRCPLYYLRHWDQEFTCQSPAGRLALGRTWTPPGLPSIHFMMSQQEKIAPVHPDFGAAFDAAVPDGIC